jgi:cytochrome c-type biogenesis protein CcmH
VRAVLAVLAALALAPAAAAGARCPTLTELEPKFVCPTCSTTLDMSNAPVAQRMKEAIRERAERCESEEEITTALVGEFGDRVLAAPPKRGFDLLAWAAPLAGLIGGASLVGAVVWRWSRSRPEPGAESPADPATNGRVPLDPELERRLDEELAHFDG